MTSSTLMHHSRILGGHALGDHCVDLPLVCILGTIQYDFLREHSDRVWIIEHSRIDRPLRHLLSLSSRQSFECCCALSVFEFKLASTGSAIGFCFFCCRAPLALCTFLCFAL